MKGQKKATRKPRAGKQQQHRLTLTTLDDVYPSSPDALTRHTLPFDKLAGRLVKPREFARKEDMPLLKLGSFGTVPSPKGYYRHDGNVTGLSGIEGDYDGEMSAMSESAARAQQAGVQAIFYTSPSHTPERPRWRVLCLFSKPYEGSEKELRALRTAQMEKLQGVLGKDCALSSESWTLSQTYYVGRKSGAPYECIVVKGKPIDTLDGLPRLPKQNGTKARDGVPARAYDDTFGVDVLRRIETMNLGTTFHEELKSITAHFAGRGLPRDLCESFISAIVLTSRARQPDHPNHARWRKLADGSEVPSAIASAYAKFKPLPAPPKKRDHWQRVERRRA
jgi:hypothetical protein